MNDRSDAHPPTHPPTPIASCGLGLLAASRGLLDSSPLSTLTHPPTYPPTPTASCGLGLLAASRGLLDSSSLSTLSRLIFAFFQPALLFTNVATTLATPSAYGRSLLVLPIFAVLQIVVGSMYGKGLAKLLKLEPTSDEGRFLLPSTHPSTPQPIRTASFSSFSPIKLCIHSSPTHPPT